ncbi:GlxA family transcriptional regulator [Kaistia dalseonensis]|uniref:Transcriptional regulator GlxA family with amidase domain n=1 Tax=Kaistia dalseonensis TaxID=410840 RepID=A0ABU0H802_9HYPH|nr:GlxA family transcriptional regulator [Kaistia dalseonensis]MCX5495839.1 GlxA family transcriptional regulator [Kaistia dalseonensis]MDQ0438440.1 transcriptional regulator GlxA family with amidase domain [Kaistia dalseonensis]
MPEQPKIVADIGLVIYPDSQLAAVYGLTDLFRIASEISEAQAQSRPTAIRVSHWRRDPVDGVIGCVYDSHPGQPHKLSHLIAPPSLIMPEKMQSMSGFSGWLLDHHAGGATICSVCAGAFVLGEAGLLDGREVTTHWAFAEELARRFPTIRVDVDRIMIDDGDVITAGGILAWTDLGLSLVERFMGPSIMLDTARFLLADPPGRTQQPYRHFLPRRDHGDLAILRSQHWMHATSAKEVSVPELARRAELEERTFLRRFRKATGLRPTEYAQQIRISKAREALELSNRSVEQIAWQVGYSDPSAFRRLFQRVTGLTPNEYRQRFGVN